MRVYTGSNYRIGASADIWSTPNGQIVVRFSYARHTKQYFRVVLPRGVTARNVDFESLQEYLGVELHDWFCDARYDNL